MEAGSERLNNVQRKEKLHVKSFALPAFAAAIVARPERLATPSSRERIIGALAFAATSVAHPETE
jgi:hypothetical protein